MNKRAVTQAGGLALAAVLGGCSTPVPQVMTPDLKPAAFAGSVASAAAWPQESWWENFGDPELTALIAKAQGENQSIAVAIEHIREAEAQTRIVRSALFPQVGGQANFQKSDCAGQGCLGFSQLQSYGLTFNASYELDIWGAAQGNVRAAKEQLKSARFAQQAATLGVIANVAQEYFAVLATRQEIAIANDEIAAVHRILDAVDVRVKAGATSGLDRAREEAQIESARAQLPTLEVQEKSALYALAVLIGQVPEGFDIGSKNLDAVRMPSVAAGLPSELLLRRPDVAQAEANLASAHANVDVARAAFLPQISLTGSGGFFSTAITTLLQTSNAGYVYGASLAETIFDAGKRAGQKHLAEATEREFVADYKGAVLNAYADVESALVAKANYADAEEHLRQEVKAATRAFDISELQFRQGAGDLLAVLQAQQTLFGAEAQLVQMTLASRQAAVHLYEALGGGWMEDPKDRT